MIDTNNDHPRWGALPEEWAQAIANPRLAPWLLTALCNTGYPAAPGSKLAPAHRAKVPSWKGTYGGSGIPQWTQRPPATPEELARWTADPDYGICVRTGHDGIAAIDCDCDDPALAPAIREVLERTIGIAAGSLSYRHRGSPRWACLLQITDQPEDPIPHDVITLTDGRGILETRGTGQHLSIAGTHPSGQRYRWTGAIAVYPVTGAQYRDFLRTAEARWGDPQTPRSTSRTGEPRQAGESYDAPDSLRDWLLAQPGLVTGTGRGGILYLACPLGDHDHDDPTSSAYMPAGSNGYHTPAYCCKHGKCAGRTVDDLRDWARAHGWKGDVPAAAYTDESARPGTGAQPIRTDLYPEDESAGTGAPPAQTAPAPYRPLYAADYAAGALEADLLLSASYKTGFGRLDEASGGIYPGLYVLGGLSGTGKTSFCLQMADQMAAAGQSVIYVTLEQSPAELVSKSLARIEYLGRHHPAARSITGRITALQIRLDPRHRQSPEYLRALETYKTQSADRLSLIVGTFGTTIDTICDHVAAHIAATGQTPIVIVDYLQIIKPAATGAGGAGKDTALRQQIDEHVQRLKLLSRDNALPVIVICSLNRTNYFTPFDVDSIKESGGIEYTADVVWGLQLKCVHVSEKEMKQIAKNHPEIQDRRDLMGAAKATNPREMELVCAKNRFGRDFTLDLWYYADVDTFSFEAPPGLGLPATARSARTKAPGGTGSKSRYY